MPIEWFKQFAQGLVKEKGISVPDEKVQLKVEEEVATKVRDAVLKALVDDLSDEEMDKVNAALDSNNEADAQAVFDIRKDLITRTMAEFRLRYLGLR